MNFLTLSLKTNIDKRVLLSFILFALMSPNTVARREKQRLEFNCQPSTLFKRFPPLSRQHGPLPQQLLLKQRDKTELERVNAFHEKISSLSSVSHAHPKTWRSLKSALFHANTGLVKLARADCNMAHSTSTSLSVIMS